MEIENLAIYLNLASVKLAFLAAGCWFYSATARVKPVEGERDEHGMKPAVIVTNGADLTKSLRAQSKWSAIAAVFAGAAAILQGSVFLL